MMIGWFENVSNSRNSSSDIGRLSVLQTLNQEAIVTYIPAIVFVSILMFFGLFGNVTAMVIYRRFPVSNHRVFILYLAAMDTVACSIVMPSHLSWMFLPYRFTSGVTCRVMCFISYWLAAASALVLLLIAVERYRKVCQPFRKQMTVRAARGWCAACVGFCVLPTWPALILYGHSTVSTRDANITGVQCFVIDEYKGSLEYISFNVMLAFVAVSAIVVLCVLYSLIARQLFVYDKTRMSMRTSSTDTVELEDLEGPCPQNECHPSSQVEYANPKDQVTRLFTVVLCFITAVYIVSFIPHFVVMVKMSLKKDFVENLHPVEAALFHLFRRSYMINHMANPIVYGFCDAKFRSSCKSFFKKLFGFC